MTSEPTPDLAQRVIHRLGEGGASLAVAESCTGGGLGAALTEIPGASRVFWGGVIAYSDQAKLELLSVSKQCLAEHGAVSEQVAASMANGVVRLSGATWGLSVTGVAGPGGGTTEKPVGTVWIGLAGPRCATRLLRLNGARGAVRRRAIEGALGVLAECV